MTILITGASGFIGRHLCARLTADDQPVLALMRRPEQLTALQAHVNALGGQGDRVTAVAGDLAQPGLGINQALPPLRAIIHLGASFGWRLNKAAARASNVLGSLAVASLAQASGCRLVFISGFMLENQVHLARLGIDADRPADTQWERVYRKAGAYEASKLEAAARVRARASEWGLDMVEVQPATVAGHSRSGALDMGQPFYQLMDNLAKGRLALVPGTPSHWLPLVAVDHLAALIARAALADQPPPRLLALDPATPTLQRMLAQLAAELNRRPPRVHVPIPILAALLKLPGLPRLMNSDPEALHFIQPTRFDTTLA